MKKQTVLDQIEIARDGTIGLRFAKEVLDDDGSIISSAPHRSTIPPGVPIDERLAHINDQLVRDLKMTAVATDDAQLARLRTVLPLVHTADVKAAYASKEAARLARDAARAEAAK